MNIFYLHKNPTKAARYMYDKHIGKMIAESSQMLSTAHRLLDGHDHAEQCGMTKISFPHHPSTVWTRTSLENYQWLFNHMSALSKEYLFRFNKIHGSSHLLGSLKHPPKNIDQHGFCPPSQAMPDEFKHKDTVTAYRNYYTGPKLYLFKYTKRQPPNWIKT